MTTRLRPTSPDDTPALAKLIVSQREHLVPWEPARPESWFTAEGQREVLEQADADRAAGRSHAFVITDGSCTLIGRLNLASVVRGAGQFCSLGYWVAREQTGRAWRPPQSSRPCGLPSTTSTPTSPAGGSMAGRLPVMCGSSGRTAATSSSWPSSASGPTRPKFPLR